MDEYGIILFHSSSSAMQAEAVLQKGNFTVKLVPTPRQLSSDCGVSLRFDWDCNQDVARLLEKMHVSIAGIHRMPGKPV
jgi:hypothetical protein